MLTAKPAPKIWGTLPAGPKKTIYKDQHGLSSVVVLCNGVYHHAALIEIDGESMVSFRRVDKRDHTFCVCTTAAVNILEEPT